MLVRQAVATLQPVWHYQSIASERIADVYFLYVTRNAAGSAAKSYCFLFSYILLPSSFADIDCL